MQTHLVPVAGQRQRGIDMPRGPYRARTWLYDCRVCHQWVPVISLEVQSICREAGACPDCIRHDFFLLRIRIVAIEQVLEWVTKRAKKLPEDQRGPLRELYSRKARQLSTVRTQLERLQAPVEV